MLALITSDRVTVGVVVGIPVLVAILVVLGARRTAAPVMGAATLAVAALIGLALYGVFRPVPGALATLPGPPSPPPSVSPAPTTPSAPACSPGGTSLSIGAQGIAFDTDCLAAPANTPVTLTFDNKDAGIPHNVEIFDGPNAAQRLGGARDVSDLVTGPGSVTYQVGPLPPGTYYFQCDVHVSQMHGTFVVA